MAIYHRRSRTPPTPMRSAGRHLWMAPSTVGGTSASSGWATRCSRCRVRARVKVRVRVRVRARVKLSSL
eukprot:scaffold33022_cov63-Phaeocystis_antarctica.AAC.1